MEFETQAQQDVYEKIDPWMKESFGILFHKREDAPYFGVSMGSAFVHVGVQPWGADNASITVRAYVAMNLDIHPDLLLFLLRENDSIRFGAFGLDSEEDIFFEYTLPGNTCTEEELMNSILAVGQVTSQYENVVVSHWGGVPASEMVNEE